MSRLEIAKFCESMNCSYAEVSVLEDRGIEELFDLVVDKCMILHEHLLINMPPDENKEVDRKDKNKSFGLMS